METKTVKELREIAKQRGLKNYYKLRKRQLIDAINTHTTDSQAQTAYNPPKNLSKVTSHIKSFADLLISYVPESIKRPINEKLEALKSTVSNLFSKFKPDFSDIVESKSAMNNFTKLYRIAGKQGVDVKTYLNAVRPLILNLLERNRGIKFNLVLTCTMKRVVITTGEVITTDAPFVSRTEVNLEATDVGELYNNAVDKIKESMASFQRTGSNWRFQAVQKLEVNTVDYRPLKGSLYIPLPKELANKKAIINFKNTDKECFKWCVVRALNRLKRIPSELRKISENKPSS